MADTEIEISGRVDRFEAALAKANAEVLKLKDALRQAAITGKQGNQDVAKSAEGAAGVMHRWGQQQIGSLAGMAAGYLTVTAAIGAVSSAYEEWNARMEKTHAKAKSFSDALAGGLFQAAAMEKMPGLKKWIEQGITGGRMLGTREEMGAALSGAMAGLPQGSTSQWRDLTANVGLAAPVLGQEELKRYGEMAGAVMRISPGMGARRAVNYAAAIAGRVGHPEQLLNREFLGGVQGLVSSGAMSLDQSLAMGTLLMERDISPGTMERFGARVAMPRTPTPAGHGRLTPQELIHNRLARMTPAQRAQAILTDPAVQEAELGTRLQRLEEVTPQAIAQRAGAIRADVGGDIWAREITSPAALQRVEGRTMKLREDQADIRDQQKAEDATRLSDERALERRDRTWYANVAVRAGIWAKWMTTTDTHGMDNVTEEIQKGNRLLRARQATDAALHAVTNSHD